MLVADSGSRMSLKKRMRPGAVHSRGLHQLVGHGQEELAEQESGRGRRRSAAP